MEMSEEEMMMCGLVDSTYLVGGGDGRCLPSTYVARILLFCFNQFLTVVRQKKKIANFGI